MGILSVLLPEVATFLDDDAGDGPASRIWRLLSEVDRRTIARGAPIDDIVIWTLLMLEPMKEACEGERDRVSAAFAFLDPVIDRLAVPRRVADAVRRIVAILPRFVAGRTGKFARTGLFELASQIHDIERAALGR
jgi:poly(A) polymerase